MKKTVILLISILWAIFCGAQSEPHSNIITYDTTISVQSDPWHTLAFKLQIRRYADTLSRVLMLFSDGDGEQGADTTKLNAYGPEPYMNSGAWDGGIQLGNGTHYPIYIKVQTTQPSGTGYTSGAFTEPLLKILVNEFHPRSVHVAGLSHGASQWLSLIPYAGAQGDTYPMQHIQSCVAMESIGGTPDGTQGPYNLPFPGCFATWAKSYGGRYFGIEGTTDLRQTYLVAEAMNAAVPGSAYETFENDGGGGHCCWQDMYRPGIGWQNLTAPYGNPWIVSNPYNSAGSYIGTGDLYSWMLRQGDTTLIGQQQPVITGNPVIQGCPLIYVVGLTASIVDSTATLQLLYNNGKTGPVGKPAQ